MPYAFGIVQKFYEICRIEYYRINFTNSKSDIRLSNGTEQEKHQKIFNNKSFISLCTREPTFNHKSYVIAQFWARPLLYSVLQQLPNHFAYELEGWRLADSKSTRTHLKSNHGATSKRKTAKWLCDALNHCTMVTCLTPVIPSRIIIG